MQNNRSRIILEFFWLVLIIFLFVFSIKIIQNNSLEHLVESFGIWAPIIFVLLKISTLVIAPLSGTPLYFLGGALFGGVHGLTLSLLGDFLGSTICFYLSRFYGQKVIKIFAGERYTEKVVKTVEVLKNTKSFIKARIALFFIPELLAYASGLSKIQFFTFLFV